MKFISDNKILICIFIYIILIGIIIYLKPKFFYIDDNNKKLKIFGTGKSKIKSIFPLWFVLIVLAIIIYFIICLFES